MVAEVSKFSDVTYYGGALTGLVFLLSCALCLVRHSGLLGCETDERLAVCQAFILSILSGGCLG